MDPVTIGLIVQVLLKYGPDAARQIVVLFSKPAPSAEDWENLFVATEKSYDAYTSPVVPPTTPQ